MPYYQTAAALATVPTDLTKLKPHLASNDVAKRMERLLENPPAEPTVKIPANATAKPPQAAFSTADYFLTNQNLLRVEVSVDISRLEDPEYKQSLIDGARLASLEFLKPLVRG